MMLKRTESGSKKENVVMYLDDNFIGFVKNGENINSD